MSTTSKNQVLIDTRGVSTYLRYTDASFVIEPTKLEGHKFSCCTGINRGVKHTEVPLRNVVSATFASGAVEVQYLVRKKKGSCLNLVMISGTFLDEDSMHAKKWCEALLLVAYQGLLGSYGTWCVYLSGLLGANPSKNLKVFVNPHGGKVSFIQTVLYPYMTVFLRERE
jgi:sphingosine kinase